jgi:probable F420-dependent oxidoreductase
VAGHPSSLHSSSLKVRVGFGLGTRTNLNDAAFGTLVDDLERFGFDSLWVSERIGGECPDPLVAMAFTAGRTTRLKFGTAVMVLPGRNPVLLAKELASLDRISGGRMLPAFGLGIRDPAEQSAFGVERTERAAWFDEALPLIRRLWQEDTVDHDGPRFHLRAVRVLPKPVQTPPDIWLGGIAPSELRRVGRLADGWLPSFVLPAEAGAGRAVVEEIAAAHDRTIDPQHFGALIAYADGPVPEATLAALARRRPDVDVRQFIPRSGPELADRVGAFVGAGFSKFVVVPLHEPPAAEMSDHLAWVAQVVLPLQT